MIIATSLQRLNLESGDVVKYISKNSSFYSGFGEVYFSHVLPNSTKGWKQHRLMTMNLTVVVGVVKFVFYSSDFSSYQSFVIDESTPRLLTVKPGYWFAFKCISDNEAIICNFSDIVHDESEISRLPLSSLFFPLENL
jgi:dTDP-4-dehydrorhamnose 3,5-epimerase